MGQQSLLDSVLWHLRSWEQIKATSWFTLSNYFTYFLLVGVVITSVWQAHAKAVGQTLALYQVPTTLLQLHAS